MALKFIIPFPLFSPPAINPTDDRRPPMEVRFSRWNNANAQKFILRERAQKEIEDEIRLQRRFDSALRIADVRDGDAPSSSAAATSSSGGDAPRFKSIGTPSSPSRPSIPGKASKYSKPPKPKNSHPAFRRTGSVQKIPIPNIVEKAETTLRVSDDGVSYVIPDAPFEFQYSYTETPKVKPLKLREPPYAPFGPGTMPRPWTGRAPLPPSKKKLKEFDSFQLPPPHKKGVKPVQAPGPFLPGSGPKYVMSREEIMGEPLTQEEVKDLIQSCIKSRRQLNMGRDGLTHNMLDNIHTLWKRRRVCKIKCKGVCTVDMNNVCQHLEDKTGGKIINRRGGVIFLFRGRNYNYRTRPRFPLMLWKPVTPVYPRLVQRAPEGLTLEEATEMRKKGRKLMPICKLGKNGVYSNLVKDVKEAFEECELVRINCEGMNRSDYHKIGAKLKDLVPCVLISFENEHILVWRGRNWKSSLSTSEDGEKNAKESGIDAAVVPPTSEAQKVGTWHDPDISMDNCIKETGMNVLPNGPENLGIQEREKLFLKGRDNSCAGINTVATTNSTPIIETRLYETASDNECMEIANTLDNRVVPGGIDNSGTGNSEDSKTNSFVESDNVPEINRSSENQANNLLDSPVNDGKLHDTSKTSQYLCKPTCSSLLALEGVVTLWKQALEAGSAIFLDTVGVDADIVYERAVVLAQSAPPAPTFAKQLRKVAAEKHEKLKAEDLDGEETAAVTEKKEGGKTISKQQRKKDNFKDNYLGVVPQGSLKIDELAKLLS